ncbi:MAG TPA: glycosyltransferase [Vicinamibacterales bacterium]|nr:glycosyltransferase [Vicinamibacterales bacterium]
MAHIAVVTSSPPLVEGGHLVIARALVKAIQEAGHEAGLIITPSNPFGQQASEYLAAWKTDVSQIGGRRVDHVISMRYPSYAVRHPSHVCWLLHTMREYYDGWEDFSSRLSPQGRVKERVRRELIRAADTYCFNHHLKALFALSATVQERLQRWNGVASTILYPPAPPRDYRCDGYGDFIFVVSRLEPLKRMGLILQALATPAAQHVRCVIAGGGAAEGALRAQATSLGLDGRVTLAGRVSDEQLVDYLARCRAVCFVPLREDYGFVTVEAFSSRKAVITVTDSGGPAELVVDGVNGRVTAPDPAALGLALAGLAADPGLAETLGSRAFAAVCTLNWSDTVGTLLEPLLRR